MGRVWRSLADRTERSLSGEVPVLNCNNDLALRYFRPPELDVTVTATHRWVDTRRTATDRTVGARRGGVMAFGWKLYGDGRTPPMGEAVAPDERLSWPRTIGIGAQHVVAMFGATF